MCGARSNVNNLDVLSTNAHRLYDAKMVFWLDARHRHVCDARDCKTVRHAIVCTIGHPCQFGCDHTNTHTHALFGAYRKLTSILVYSNNKMDMRNHLGVFRIRFCCCFGICSASYFHSCHGNTNEVSCFSRVADATMCVWMYFMVGPGP